MPTPPNVLALNDALREGTPESLSSEATMEACAWVIANEQKHLYQVAAEFCRAKARQSAGPVKRNRGLGDLPDDALRQVASFLDEASGARLSRSGVGRALAAFEARADQLNERNPSLAPFCVRLRNDAEEAARHPRTAALCQKRAEIHPTLRGDMAELIAAYTGPSRDLAKAWPEVPQVVDLMSARDFMDMPNAIFRVHVGSGRIQASEILDPTRVVELAVQDGMGDLTLSAFKNLRRLTSRDYRFNSPLDLRQLSTLRHLSVEGLFDSRLDVTGLVNLRTIRLGHIFNQKIVGLSTLQNLHELDLDYRYDTPLDLSGTTELRVLTLSGLFNRPLDLSNTPRLEVLILGHRFEHPLKVNHLDNLRELHLGNKFNHVDVSNIPGVHLYVPRGTDVELHPTTVVHWT